MKVQLQNSLKKFPEVTEKVKVLEKSDLIPGITLTVSSKLDDATKQKN